MSAHTARLATISGNIEFNVTAAESDPRGGTPAAAVETIFQVVSHDKVSKPDCLMLKANVDGVFSIKQDNEFILRDKG